MNNLFLNGSKDEKTEKQTQYYRDKQANQLLISLMETYNNVKPTIQSVSWRPRSETRGGGSPWGTSPDPCKGKKIANLEEKYLKYGYKTKQLKNHLSYLKSTLETCYR